MGNKLFFIMLSFFWILFFWWYTLVYSSFYKNTSVNILNFSSKNIYIHSSELQSNIVYFTSEIDISKYTFSSACNIESKFLYSNQSKYAFSLKISNQNCNNENFYLKDENGKTLLNTYFNLDIISESDLYNLFTDYSFENLQKNNQKIITLKEKYKIFLNVPENNENIDFIKKSRYYKELDYNSKIIENIIFQRQFKYKIPIDWFDLPSKNINKLPNWLRPYRASYTNAIHEGWDIDALLWQEVVSIDGGVVIRVTRDFKFSDLWKIKKWEHVNYDDKVNNLDILRWNQVWIKTMKWDIIFYSHLSKVYDDIQVWNIVSKWYPLGKVWKTWVPDRDYEDYHLHFELRKNPYFKNKIWKNTNTDYMNWDWYFKNETREYIKENQYTIFEK